MQKDRGCPAAAEVQGCTGGGRWYRYRGAPGQRFSGVQMCRCADMQMWKGGEVQRHRGVEEVQRC